MKKLTNFLSNEMSGWTIPEIAWLFMASIGIIALSIYWKDTPMGIISSTTGVICVVCTGKGKLSAYVFGLINSVLYAIIAYRATYYGETMLNLLYYVPMQFIGFYVWNRNMNEETHEVKKRHMKNSYRILTVLSILVCTILYGLILQMLGDAMPYVDSFTTVCSVIAMVVSVKMFSEQWWIWVAVDILSVYMWWINFRQGSDNIATLLMWIIYLGNAVIMLIRWEREIKKAKCSDNGGEENGV